jgi:hypothetical protein
METNMVSYIKVNKYYSCWNPTMETGLDYLSQSDANCNPIQKRSIFQSLERIDFDAVLDLPS